MKFPEFSRKTPSGVPREILQKFLGNFSRSSSGIPHGNPRDVFLEIPHGVLRELLQKCFLEILPRVLREILQYNLSRSSLGIPPRVPQDFFPEVAWEFL